MFADLTLWELCSRLLVALLLGAVIGLERDLSARRAGARTHALVALGAAMFTMTGAYGFGDVETSPAADPARVAAQVATGVGFIGAGAIIRHGTAVRGITTAASVWVAAALGVAAGAGAQFAATIATVAAILVLVGLRYLRPLTDRLGRHQSTIEIVYRRGHGTLGPLLRVVTDNDGRIDELTVDDEGADPNSDGLRHVIVRITAPRQAIIDHFVDTAGRLPEVTRVRMSETEEA